MSHFYAGFDYSAGCPIRTDTRIYLRSSSFHSQSGKRCVGVVWMCNPGSAGGAFVPRVWGEMVGDPTLWRVLGMLRIAFPSVSYGDEYVQILNLFYATGVSVPKAWRLWRTAACTYSEPVPSGVPVILAWGRRGTVGATRLRMLVPPALATTTKAASKIIHSFGSVASPGFPLGPFHETDHPLGPYFSATGIAALI